jgi:hypothetical protein
MCRPFQIPQRRTLLGQAKRSGAGRQGSRAVREDEFEGAALVTKTSSKEDELESLPDSRYVRRLSSRHSSFVCESRRRELQRQQPKRHWLGVANGAGNL